MEINCWQHNITTEQLKIYLYSKKYSTYALYNQGYNWIDHRVCRLKVGPFGVGLTKPVSAESVD